MLVAHYDETGFLSFYDTALNYFGGIPTPNIPITTEQHADFFARGQRHRVIDGKWTYVEPPALTTEELQKQKLAALDAEYQSQFATLAQSLGLATLDGNQTVADSIKADYATLKTEYQKKRQVIIDEN